MNPAGLTPWKITRWGGEADWDDVTQIPNGLALKARNARFRAESVACRFGRKNTMSYATAADVTGLECLNVLGAYAKQVPLVWLSTGGAGGTGILLEESPPGSGTLVPLTPPFSLPGTSHLMAAQAFNREYMTVTDMFNGLALPMVLDGPTGNFTPVSQNTPGALWQPAMNYFAGDLVRTTANAQRWFLASNTGISGVNEPSWPVLDGYFEGALPHNAFVVDNAGANHITWTEWTPGIAAYVPAPEAPEQILSVKGQAGAPAGTIGNALDVYVSVAYENANGESIWTLPIKFSNTANNDVLEVFFQQNGENPGPVVPAVFGAAGYGGPRMPRWFMGLFFPLVGGTPQVDITTDPLISWPSPFACMNVYVASVAHGAGAPTAFKLYAALTSPTAPVVITAISGSGAHAQLTVSTAALTDLEFLGESGKRNLIVLRTDYNDSLSPADPGATLSAQFLGSFSANITAISRNMTGLVTAELDDITQLAIGQNLFVANASDPTLDGGAFQLLTLIPGVLPAGGVTWQTGVMSATTGSAQGTIATVPGPPPVVVVPPGYNDALDVIALTVAGAGVAGPYTWIDAAIPPAIFSTVVTACSAANGGIVLNVKDPSGISLGSVVILASIPSPLNNLNGLQFGVAAITGNTVLLADITNSTGALTNIAGSLTVQQVLPTAQPPSAENLTIANITALRLLANGQVIAQVDDASFVAPGMRVAVFNSGDGTLDRQIGELQTVVPAAVGNGGTISWQSTILGAPFTAAPNTGVLIAAPGIILNFDDNTLADSSDVTSQLTAIGAPKSIDIAFSESQNRMVYTPGGASTHYFSNIGDAENIQSPDGILAVNDNDGYPTICFREMQNGELLSLKENGGYAITPSDLPPAQWGVGNRWRKRGPVGPDAAKVAKDFMILFSRRTGPYRYFEGELTWIGHEKQATWDTVNWDASREVSIEIDEDNHRVFFLLPLNGSTTCNSVQCLDYSMGWQDPLIVMLDGSVKPNRYARRWSSWPLACRKMRAMQRTLAVPVDSRINKFQPLFGIAAGTLALPHSFVQMEVPDLYADDTFAGGAAAGIDFQYLPAFARSMPAAGQSPATGAGILSWEMVTGRARGNGAMVMTQTTDDPTFGVAATKVPSVALTVPVGKTAGTPIKFAKSLGEVMEKELLSLNFNNAAAAGNWAELHEITIWAKEKYPCRPAESSAV